MNHCQPDRILQPNHPDYPTHSGFVITPPLANSSNYRHYVFSDKESPIYKMPANLFRLSNYRGMKNTQILRAEKSLEFGNNIYFTVNPHTNEVLDYELGLPVHVTECIEGLNLVRTIALLPPKSVGKFCWTELFGRIDLSDEMFERLHLEAKHDVPITAWILVDLESDGWDVELICSFYEFIEVAVDDRKIAWDAEWNMNHVNRPTNYYKFDTTDDEDEEEQPLNPIIEKKEEQILDVRLNLEGYLIDSRELFCPELKDYCVEIGLWSKKDAKLDNNYDLLGNKYKFDVYFSDVLQIYIAYYFEDITEKYYDEEEGRDVYDKECWVILEDYGTDKLLQIEIFPSDNYGSFYNTHEKFGLIADSGHVLGPLPLLFAELETYSLWVNVIDTGPGKKLSRFTIAELERQPEETYGLIEEAKNLAMEEIEVKEGSEKKIERKHKICNEGFVLDDNLTFFSPAYANQKIVLPEMYRQHVKIGQWIKFEALYNKEANFFEIVGGVSAEQPPVPHNKIVETVDGKTKNKYLFKIEAEMIQNPQKDPSKFFLAGCIYNPQYGGLIADPDGKFKKVRKRAKMQKIIVECVPGGQALFKLVRMSTGNEQMDSEKQDFLPNNGEDKDEDSEIGLELEDEIDFNEADENEIMQTDYLSESQIRERQIRARDRRRQRDKEEKEIQERLRQLVLEEEINEEFLDPRPSTSAAAI